MAKRNRILRRRDIVVRDFTPADWPILEGLFGSNGACGGCWCMHFRVVRGGKLWEEQKGEKNRLAFRELVTAGQVHGCLAFVEAQAVGWCAVDRRADFIRMERSRVLRSEWDEHTWSVPCFFIARGWTGQGIAGRLLAHAVGLARRLGARRLEGYPVVPKANDHRIAAAFAFTGVASMFEKAGFVDSRLPGGTRPIYVKRFRPSKV